MRKLFLLLLIMIGSNAIRAQAIDTAELDSPPKSLDEIIKQMNGDTLMIYYSTNRTMVRPICASIIRITRIDTALPGFIGHFVDYYRDSTRAVEGNYMKGKKEGVFTLFYSNGQIEETGSYQNNEKTGVWNYFYEDGKRKQVFEFHGAGSCVPGLLRKKCQSDFFERELGIELPRPDHYIMISGPVMNGRKNGIWTSQIPSRGVTTNTENYRMLSGKSNAPGGGLGQYKGVGICIVETKPDFENAELFRAGGCQLAANRLTRERASEKWEYASYPGGTEELQLAIRNKINDPDHTRGTVIIKIRLNEFGAMTNFIPMTSIGIEDEVIRVLKTLKRWNPTRVNGVPREWETTIRINVF